MTIYITADDYISLDDSISKEIYLDLPSQVYEYWNEETQQWENVSNPF